MTPLQATALCTRIARRVVRRVGAYRVFSLLTNLEQERTCMDG
jgi:hypothetical protein